MTGAGAIAASDAAAAMALFAVDPFGTGIVLRSRAGPARARWLSDLKSLLPDMPHRVLPLHVSDDRLLGGLDLTATLLAERPIAQQGMIAEANGGILQISMAERVSATTAAHIASALDTGEIVTTRDGIDSVTPSQFAVIAIDEGIDDECPPAALTDRLAFHLSPDAGAELDTKPLDSACSIAAARARLRKIRIGEEVVEAICAATLAFGIASVRAASLALRAARASAALAGRTDVSGEDVTLAARLVLAPRAQSLPMDDEAQEQNEPAPPDDQTDAERDPVETPDQPLDDLVLEAVKAAIPPGMLAQLRLAHAMRARSPASSKSGAVQRSTKHGRPIGARRGEWRGGARLDVIETLRAAAPWQPLRRRTAQRRPSRVELRRDDFRIKRFKKRTETIAIFVVDASGSSALQRLAEAKGAVELLLADCYVRRDQVALLAFRGRGAELLLPPTRSLVRAKRSLAALPGGGGTPLAAGIEAACALADVVKRKGQTPIVILLTDGRANIARDGAAGRGRAAEDALSAAKMLRALGIATMLLDTSPQPQETSRAIASAMGAHFLPLPHADSSQLSRAVRAAMPAR